MEPPAGGQGESCLQEVREAPSSLPHFLSLSSLLSFILTSSLTPSIHLHIYCDVFWE